MFDTYINYNLRYICKYGFRLDFTLSEYTLLEEDHIEMKSHNYCSDSDRSLIALLNEVNILFNRSTGCGGR